MSLIDVLKRCRELSLASQDAVWSSTGVAEIVAILDRGIAVLEGGTELNREELKLLFAPTGALQETAMDNGWSSEYLFLSERFDNLIDAMSKGWATRWREAGWVTGEGKPTAHADLWDALLELCAVHEVAFVWLPAEGIGEYAECHRLARQVIEEQLRQVAETRGARAEQ